MNLYRRIKGNRPMDADHENANAVMRRRRNGDEAGTITVFDDDPEAARMDTLGLIRARDNQMSEGAK